jgi:hypothetical protein
MIAKFLDTREGQIIISIILGLGLASLFRKVCKDNNCVIIKSPKRSEVENKVFKQDDKCYTYQPKKTKCEN